MKLFERRVKEEKTKNPWLLETVENGLKATNIFDSTDSIRPNRSIPIQYFEFDRLFGKGAFQTPLKVMDMFGELQDITPRTKGFIFGEHKYLYHGLGILRVNHETNEEAYFSRETLRNENVSCYLGIVVSTEEQKIKQIIEELDAATSGRSTEDSSRKRIQGPDSE